MAKVAAVTEFRRKEAILKTGALQNAILNSANFSSIATDEKGVIQLFNVGAERMLGYAAAEVVDQITPADISDHFLRIGDVGGSDLIDDLRRGVSEHALGPDVEELDDALLIRGDARKVRAVENCVLQRARLEDRLLPPELGDGGNFGHRLDLSRSLRRLDPRLSQCTHM